MEPPESDDAYRARIAAQLEEHRDEMAARMAAYEAKARAFRQRKAEIFPVNKGTLFAALAAAGIASVVVTFDGSGDSGQIESMTAHEANGTEAPLPEQPIEIHGVSFDDATISVSQPSLHEAIERMVYDFLEETHGGWENEDGAYGDCTFTVAEQAITLDYNERYTETHSHWHEF